MYKNCLIIGSFAPPHAGHLFMIDSATAYAERVNVAVYSYDNKIYNYIDGITRFNWLVNIYKNDPSVTIYHDSSIMPQTPEEHGDYDDFYNIWTKSINNLIPDPIDLVVGSEEYVKDIAKFLNCGYKIIDAERKVVPMCGTNIRKTPFKYWEYIPLPVRSYFNKKIAIVGGESCGKSVMTKLLARVLNTNYVEEYGRHFAKEKGERCWCSGDFVEIMCEQINIENEQIINSNKFLICDTDVITTKCFHRLYMNFDSGLINRCLNNDYEFPDLYFLLAPTVEFIQDGTREFMDQREEQFNLIKSELDYYKCNYVVIDEKSYDDRLNKILKTIKEKYDN